MPPETSTSTRGSSACGSSRRASTRTTRPSITSSTETTKEARAATSRSSNTRTRAAARRAPGWCTASCGAWPPRTRSRSGRSVSRPRALQPSAPAARCSSRIPRGSHTSSWSSRSTTRRSPPTTRRSRRRSRFRAFTRSAPTRPIPRRAARSSSRRSASSRTARPPGRSAETSAARSTSSTPRTSAASAERARSITSPGRRRWKTTRRGRSASPKAGASPTPVIDRFYFKSIYFREPSGVLFEIATIGPGFDTDEPLEHLGERLSLPPAYEQLRDRLEQVLTPLPDPRATRVGR